MKYRILKIITLITIVSSIAYFNGSLTNLFKPATAYAVGDLIVDWGVAEGNPIFTVNNFAPGQSESRVVNVANGAASARPVGGRGILGSQTNNIATVLDFVIKDGVTDVYGGTSPTGPKTLAQFFSESATISGIPLSTIAPGGNRNYSFIVTFQNSAGNEFQNSNLTFDLKIGIFFEVPTACSGIIFSSNPIFGTDGSDTLRGTRFNDLILGLNGNDAIDGGNGKDCIIAGQGNNSIRGGNETDVITTGNGNNFVDGGNEGDVISTGNGNDSLNGGNGEDKIQSGGGNDFVEGGNGNDQIDGGSGNDELRGSNGDDTLIGNSGTDMTDGGNGNDSCDAESKIRCEL